MMSEALMSFQVLPHWWWRQAEAVVRRDCRGVGGLMASAHATATRPAVTSCDSRRPTTRPPCQLHVQQVAAAAYGLQLYGTAGWFI